MEDIGVEGDIDMARKGKDWNKFQQMDVGLVSRGDG